PMSYFHPLLQDVYGEVMSTSAAPERFEVEGGINALVLAPLDAQTKHFMTMVCPDLRWSGLTAEELKALALLVVESSSPTALARNLPATVSAHRPYVVRYFGRSSAAEVARARHRNEFPVYYHDAIRSGRISYDHLVRDLSLFYEELARFRSRRAMSADIEEVAD
ncbi:hypothetical protein FOL47_007136, partial [Perkinsus chesapeaki]